MESYFFNKEVIIDAVYFKHQNNRLKSYPKHMIVDGQGVTFKTGLERLAQEGKRAARLFEMTDGRLRYRLKLDQETRTWKLLRVAEVTR